MRADKRSFSFTWMRGQNKDNNHNSNLEDGGIENQMMDINVSTTSSSSGVSSMSGSSSSASIFSSASDAASNQVENETPSMNRSNSKGRMRRLGHSFTRFGTKYSIIEDDEENQPLNSVETPIPPTPTPTVKASSSKAIEQEQAKDVQPVHFDEDGNFIGRQGQGKSASRRKPRASSANKDLGSSAGRSTSTSSSLGRKLNKTVQDVKASIGSFSQKFRRSTRRRYRMGNGTPRTEMTPTRKILGRTPTKLYSPFEIGFETPVGKTPRKRLERPSTPRLTRRNMVSGILYSPANTFGKDLADARRGMEDFHILSRDITRRSVRF